MWFGREENRSRRGRLVVTVVVVACLLAACGEQSRIDEDAVVQVRGAAVAQDGSPLSDRPVRLGSGVTDLEGAAGVFTVGLFCLGGECRGDTFDTITDADGRFRFELTGADTQSGFGEATSFLLSTSAPPPPDRPTGPSVAARFRIQATDLQLPTLHVVDPRPSMSTAAGDVVVAWSEAGAPGPYTVGFADADGGSVWAVDAAAGSVAVDGRVLEDVVGVAAVEGRRRDQIEGSDIDIRWQSSGTAFRGGRGAPPSRGADCLVAAEDGRTETITDCALTDGDFTAGGTSPMVCDDAAPEARRCTPASRVRVLLPSPVPADLVVVRGCLDACTLRTMSTGSGDVVEEHAVTAPNAAIDLGGTTIDAVELSAADVHRVSELSVWSPAPPDAAPLAPVGDRVDELSFGVAPDGGSSRWPWWAAIAVLGAAVLLGAGILVGRRTASR